MRVDVALALLTMWLGLRDAAPYLVHGNCIYDISSGWDAQKQELR